MKVNAIQITAVAFILFAVYSILDTDTPSHMSDIVIKFVDVIAIFGAAVVLLKKNDDVYFASGAYSSLLGLSMSVTSIELTWSSDPLVFTMGIVAIASGLMMILFSFSLYCGDRYNIQRITVIALIYFGMALFSLLYTVAFDRVNFGDALYQYRYILLSLIMFALFLVVVNDRSIRYDRTNKKINSNLDSITSIVFNDDNAHVMRSVLLDAINDDTWTEIKEGPIIAETTMPLIVNGKPALLIGHKWNDGRYTAEIVRSNHGTIIQSLRFWVTEIVMDNDDPKLCKTITYYGTDGFFIKLLVNDEQSKIKKMSKGAQIIYKLIGY